MAFIDDPEFVIAHIRHSCVVTDETGNSTMSTNQIPFLLNKLHGLVICLFSNRSQMTSKYGKKKKVVHETRMSMMFLRHFVSCDVLLYRPVAT